MINPFATFRKIDAHSHIGMFGAPFNVNFNAEMLSAQMAEYNIEKTILLYRTVIRRISCRSWRRWETTMCILMCSTESMSSFRLTVSNGSRGLADGWTRRSASRDESIKKR